MSAKKFGEIRNKDTGETIVEMFGPGRDEDALSIGLRILTHQLMLRDPSKEGGFGFGGRYGYGVDFENDVFEMRYDRQDYDCTCGGTEPVHSQECQAATREWCDRRWKYVYPPKTQEQYDAEVSAAVARGIPPRMAALGACGTEMRFDCDDKFEEYRKIEPPPVCLCPAATWIATGEHTHECQQSIADRPNFTHKPSGFTVEWYKYIGRDNRVSNGQITGQEWADILTACLASFGGPSLEDAARAYESAEQEEAAAFKRAMDFWTQPD